MRAYDQGAFVRVTAARDDVEDFADRWPCYGPRNRISATFARSNGDLVDLYGDTPDNDGAGISALVDDMKRYAQRRGYRVGYSEHVIPTR